MTSTGETKYRITVYKVDPKSGQLRRHAEFIRDPDTQEHLTRARAEFWAAHMFREEYDPRDFEIYVEKVQQNMGADTARRKHMETAQRIVVFYPGRDPKITYYSSLRSARSAFAKIPGGEEGFTGNVQLQHNDPSRGGWVILHRKYGWPGAKSDAARAKKSKRKSKRPPKQWFQKCVRAVKRSSPRADPKKVCGANWYHKMSPAKKRAAIRAEKQVKGTITNWFPSKSRSGWIINGKFGRKSISTSAVENLSGHVVTTISGSRYKLGKPRRYSRGLSVLKNMLSKDRIWGDPDYPLLTSEEGIPPTLIEHCVGEARRKVLRESGRKQLPKGEWLKLRQNCVEKLQKYMSGRADSAKTKSRSRRVGTSKKHTICQRCGKKNLKKTHVFDMADGSRCYLGSECARSGKRDRSEWLWSYGDWIQDIEWRVADHLASLNPPVSYAMARKLFTEHKRKVSEALLERWKAHEEPFSVALDIAETLEPLARAKQKHTRAMETFEPMPTPTKEGLCLDEMIKSGLAKNQREAFYLCVQAQQAGIEPHKLVTQIKGKKGRWLVPVGLGVGMLAGYGIAKASGVV